MEREGRMHYQEIKDTSPYTLAGKVTLLQINIIIKDFLSGI